MPKDDMKVGIITQEFVDKAYLIRLLNEYNFFTINTSEGKFMNVEQGELDGKLLITFEDGDDLFECALSNNVHALYRLFAMLRSGELTFLHTRR